MKAKKNAIQCNTEAINDFLSVYGATTQKEMSAFLFDLRGCYLSQPGVSWTDKAGAPIVGRFGLLFRLVNEIQAVE